MKKFQIIIREYETHKGKSTYGQSYSKTFEEDDMKKIMEYVDTFKTFKEKNNRLVKDLK
jgi:hypothetical protein